jgi:RND superfamily putative drug exporter
VQLPRAARRAALGAAAAEGRADEPAVGRRRLRRARRGVPVGWLDGVTGYDSLGYINAVTPPLLLAIVFGLSMDYEVFLLSRIRERHRATGDNRRAVAEGLQGSAKMITSAALIMVVVFGTFTLTGVPQIKEIGVGLSRHRARRDARAPRARAGTMELMGDSNWWLPKRLERILPRADFESSPDLPRAR